MKPKIELYEDKGEKEIDTNEDWEIFFEALPRAIVGAVVLFAGIIFLCILFS